MAGRRKEGQEVGSEISCTLSGTGPGPQLLPPSQAAAAAESTLLLVFPGGFLASQPLTLGDDISTPHPVTPG